MKLRLPHLLRRLLISAMTVTGVTVGTSNSDASIMNSDVSLVTYADFGQNLGWYKTDSDANALLTYLRQQQGGVTISYLGGQETYTLPHEMGNFTGATDNGAFMALGYNATASVQHNGVFAGSFTTQYVGDGNAIYYQGIEYRIDNSETFLHSPKGGYDGRGNGGFDHKVTRMSKLITDVEGATLFSGTSEEMRNYVAGELVYHVGAGTMQMYDAETGKQSGLLGAYHYIVGGIETATHTQSHNGGDITYISFSKEGHESITTADPLPFAGQQGDSGSPMFVYNENTGQYEYIGAVAYIGGNQTQLWGAIDYVRSALTQYDKLVHTTDGASELRIGAVNKAGETITADNAAYNYGMNREVSTTPYSGKVTGNGIDVDFVGVQTGINTWKDLSSLRNTNNWYSYNNDFLNAAPHIEGAHATADKELTYADLFVTENLVFAAGTAQTNIVLDATVDLGIGYAQFSLGGTEENPVTSARFDISASGNYQFNHAGYVIDQGVDVYTTLTGHQTLINAEGISSSYMFEWRKLGAGHLHIEGSGNNDIFLNVGGVGKTYLNRENGYAAYNVLANTHSTVVINDIGQIYRDFTFGHQGGVLDMNGNTMEWNNANGAAADGFTIHALDDQAIVANLKSGSTTTLTWTQGGEQTFLGSFADNGKDSALKFIYNGGEGASLTLNSIKTHLTNANSGMEVQSGTLTLVGTNTVHGKGSLTGTNANRYHSDLDWHYADATSNVTVAGGTFELGSHARLTGNVTVQDGGTFLMREGVQHAQEYIEGSTVLMNTAAINKFYGLKGNVVLNGGTMKVQYNPGATVNNTYDGRISGSGSIEIDLGSADAMFTLAGRNTFTGAKTLASGVLIGANVAALGNVAESGWLIRSGATLQVASGLTASNALSLIDSSSTGTLALMEDMAGVLDTSNHAGLFVGAMAGATVQYGSETDSIAAVNGQYLFGGGGGELVINAQLTGNGVLVLGDGQGLGGIVTLANAGNQISGITFRPGVTLSVSSADALGNATIDLVYGANILSSADAAAMLGKLTANSAGALLLDRVNNADLDLSQRPTLSLGSLGNTRYSGTLTVGADAAYYVGGTSGTLTLDTVLKANGSNALIVDGQGSRGGKVVLTQAAEITGDVTVRAAKDAATTGDVTLDLDTDQALQHASSVTVAKGGIVDIGSTTQTLKNVQVQEGGLLRGESGSTVTFDMQQDQSQKGSLQLGNAQKTGEAGMMLESADNSWDNFTISQGAVFTMVDNALSATGITRVESGAELNLAATNSGRTMQGNVVLAGGSLEAGSNDYNITFNGSISAEAGSTGTINGGNKWVWNTSESNRDGGTLVFNSSRLELNQGYDQYIGGTFEVGADTLALHSDGATENMLKHFNSLNLAAGKTLNITERTWNTIWQLDELRGAGTINWDSTTTHSKTARLILGGEGEFSGTINMLRRYADGGRTHQAYIEINGENAVSGATLNFSGTGANSQASLAINADNVNIGGLQSDVSMSGQSGSGYAHIYAGAAVENSASTAAPVSTRKATLTLTGDGTYTYGGQIGSTSDSTTAGLSLVMNGAGTQTLNGSTIVVNDLSVLQGELNVQLGTSTQFEVMGNVGVAQGATLSLTNSDNSGYATYTLGSGHTLNVLAGASGSANLNANLVLAGGTIDFDASILTSTTPVLNFADGYGVTLAADSQLVISLSNASQLGVSTTQGKTLLLSSDNWEGVDVGAITLANMPHLSATFTANSSGLSVYLAYKSGSTVWSGTSSSQLWHPFQFSQQFGAITSDGVAVFDDSAAVTEVLIQSNSTSTEVKTAKMIFNADKDYYLTTNTINEKYGAATLTASALDQLGAGTTTLDGDIIINGETFINNGQLVVTRSGQLTGTVYGDGTLVADAGKGNTMEGMSISQLGTLKVKSGSYNMAANEANDDITNISNVVVEKGANLNLAANATLNSQVELAGGTLTMNAGSLKGSVKLTGDAELAMSQNDTTLSASIDGAGHVLTKTGTGKLLLDHGNMQLKQLNVAAGNVQVGTQVTGLESIRLAAGESLTDKGSSLIFEWGGGMKNTDVLNTEVVMGSGSSIIMKNGGVGTVSADVKLEGNYVYIQGGHYNGNCALYGTISTNVEASRTLTLKNDEAHQWTLASTISDGSGVVKLATAKDGGPDPLIVISGNNSYSGGTMLEYGTITTSHANALGTGVVSLGGYGSDSDGKLLLNKNLTVAAIASTAVNGVSTTAGTLSLNNKTLTVGAYDYAKDAVYAGSFNNSLIGSVTKIGTNKQEFTSATAKVRDVSVQGGSLVFSNTAAQIVGDIEVGTESGAGSLTMAGSYTLDSNRTLSILSTERSTLGGLTLNGGVMALLFDEKATADTVALMVTGAVQNGSMTLLLNGLMPTATGEYLLVGGDFSNVGAGGISIAVNDASAQQLYAARSGEETPELYTSVKTTADGLYLVLSEEDLTNTNVWTPTEAGVDDVWSTTSFSRYDASGLAEGAIFDASAIDKSVRVTENVSVSSMSISGGGYSFSGEGQISLSGSLDVSEGDASIIDKINIPTGPITVSGTELTIVQLTPTNPAAPIQLTNAAKLTIGSADYRYGSFSGQVTGDAGSQLHLYTTQVSGNYWQQDGTIQLLAGSTVQDVYIHGDLALNIISGSQGSIGDKFTNVQGANLHMDAGSQLVVRAEEGTGITPTTGNIVLGGDLSIVTYSPLTTATSITSNFTQEADATTNLKKVDTGSITLSGSIDVDAITVEKGTLNLTGANTNTMVYTVASGATLTLAGDSAYSFNASAERTINGTLNIDSVVNVSGTGRITIASGGQITLGSGASLNRTQGNGGAYWIQGTLQVAQGATASFTSVDDVHFYSADTGKIELKSGSTLNMNVKSLQYWRPATISLEADSTLNLTTSDGLKASSAQGNNTPDLDIILAAGSAVNVLGGDVTLAAGSALSMGEGADFKMASGILYSKVDIGTAGVNSTLTLAGGQLYLNLDGDQESPLEPTYQTVYSTIVVNNTAATAEAPSTSVIKNMASGESMNRTLESVNIAAHNTLELQQNNWNTVWNINDLTGAGNLTWKSATNHNTTSRLVLSGDGSDFTGTLKVDRSYSNDAHNSARPYQAFVEIASDKAVQGAVVDLQTTVTSSVKPYIALAINTAHATMQGLRGDAYAHLYAGEARTNATNANAPASTAANTLTIAGADTYTFAGTVGVNSETAHLNLAMTGEGSQTFSGVAHVGDVSVSSGSLALSNSNSKVYGDITVSGGVLDLDATYTLGADQTLSVLTGTANSVQLGGLTLSGGEMVFDASMLSGDTAALSVGTLSLSEGTTTQNITFNNDADLETGRYLLSGSWTALDGLTFTAGGFSNGSANVVMQDGKLYLDYVSDKFIWTGSADGNWNYSSQNWDNTPNNDADADSAFSAGKIAIFETDANVTVSEAVSANKLIVRDDATVSITETAALTAQSIEVQEGATLAFKTQKDGYTAGNMTGEGTVELALSGTGTGGAGSSGWDNKVQLGTEFGGKTYITSGNFDLCDASVGSELRLAHGVNANAYSSSTTLSANLVLDGTSYVHANSTYEIIYNGGLTGTQGDFRSAGGGTHTFNGTVNINKFETADKATVKFNASTTINTLNVTQGTVNFNGATDITTATISGGTVYVNSNDTNTSAGKLIKAITLGNGSESAVAMYFHFATSPSDANGQNTINIDTLSINGTGRLGVERSNSCWQGTINIANLKNETPGASGTLTLTAGNQVDLASVVNLNGGLFNGTINIEDNSAKGTGTPNRKFAVNLNAENVAGGAIIQFMEPSSATDTDKAYNHIALGLGATNVKVAGLSGETTNAANIYAYQIKAGDDFTNKVNPSDTAARTLELNVTSDTPLTTNANINGNISLVKTGAGSQTISGVAAVGSLTVKEGMLALTNEASTATGDITVSGGSLNFGGSYTLGAGQVLSVLTGTADAVQLGGLTLEGGMLTFDAASLTANTAALNVGATVGAGSGATVTLDFSKMTGAMLTGTYMLAAGDWTGANLTYGGTDVVTLNATSNGLFLEYTNDSVYTWVAGAVDGEGAANNSWSAANWDLTPDADASNNLLFATGKDAIFNTNASVSVTDAVSAGTVSILNGAQVSLGMSGAESSFAAEELIVANGKLTLGSEKNWSGIKDITIKADGVLELAYGTGINNSADATDILLQGGTINLLNGGAGHHALHADITVDGTGTIAGSLYGDGTTVSGTITGTGVLSFTKDVVNNGTNTITVSSTITDGADGPLSLTIDSTKVKLTGTNTYTGGTTIGSAGTLILGKLADGSTSSISGAVDVYGVLRIDGGDATGYGGSNQTISDITIYAGGKLNVNTTANQTGSGIDIQLQGGTMTGVAGSNFDLAYGGDTRGYSTITALAAAGATAESPTISTIESASITLRQRVNVFDVQENALLRITGALKPGTGTAGDKNYINGDQNKTGDGSLTKTGLGELVLSGANTYTAATTVAAGTLTLAHAGALNSNVTVNEGALFRLEATGAKTFAKTISGAGAVEKTGAGTLTLTGAHTYTGDTTIKAGTLVLSGAASLAAESDIAVESGAVFLVNTSQALTLGNDISGQGTLHKKGTQDLNLAGSIDISKIELADTAPTDFSWQNKWNAGALTFTGDTVKVGSIHAGYGTLNIGGTTEGSSTFVQTSRIETGDSDGGGNTTVTINSGSTLTVTGDNNDGTGNQGYKNASIIFGEWNNATNLTVAGSFLSKAATVLVGDNSADITIEDGGVMAVKGITHAKGNKGNSVSVTLNDGGTLILGSAGLTTDKTFTGMLGAGTVGLSAATTTIAENLTLTSAEGTDFDTTQYAFVTNTDNVATGIERGTEAGVITLTGSITAAEGVAAKVNVKGNGTLKVAGAGSVATNVEVDAGATFELNANTQDMSYGHVISGEGNVLKSGTHNLTFTQDHSFTGTTTIADGTLILDLGVPTENDQTAIGTYSLDGAVTGAGTLQVNAYTTLEVNSAAHTIGTAVNLMDDAKLHLKVDGDYTVGTTISGAGGVLVDAANHKVTFNSAQAYTGITAVNSGTLELAGNASLAEVNPDDLDATMSTMIGMKNGATLLLNTTQNLTLNNWIDGGDDSILHKAGAYETVLGNGVYAGIAKVAGVTNNADYAGTLTLTGMVADFTQLYVVNGHVNVGGESGTETYLTVNQLEMGDVNSSAASSSLTVRQNSIFYVTGNNNGTAVEGGYTGDQVHKNASFLVAEWDADTTLTVEGVLLVKDAKVTMGDAKTSINIDGGTLAAQGISDVRTSKTGTGLDLTLTNGGQLILGAEGLSTAQTANIQLGQGTVKMTAEQMTIAEDVKLTSAAGTTFDTTQYEYRDKNGYTTVASTTEGGTMIISGNITSAEGVEAEMKVAGVGELQLTGNAALSGGMEVAQHATVNVGDVFSLSSADEAGAATVDGPVSITQATDSAATVITGTGDTQTRMVNSLITIEQGASLTVENMLVSDTSRISGTPAVQTYATREGGSNIDVSQVKVVNTTIELSQNNAQVAAGDDGSTTTSITLGQLQAVGTSDASGALTLSGASNVMTVNSNALSNLLVLEGSSFVVDFSYLLNAIQLKDVDFIYLDFASVNYENLAGSTISATMDGHTIRAYFAGTVATVDSPNVPNVGVYFDVSAIPEPTTTTLSILALAGLMVRRRRK